MSEEGAHHVVTWKQLLQELSLFMLHRFNNELVIAGEVEPGAAGTGVGQLDQGLVTDGKLKFTLSYFEFVLQCMHLKRLLHYAESVK